MKLYHVSNIEDSNICSGHSLLQLGCFFEVIENYINLMDPDCMNTDQFFYPFPFCV